MKQDTTTSSTSTERPVPSITLSITQDDVKRVLEASKAMAETLARLQQNSDVPVKREPAADTGDVPMESTDAKDTSPDAGADQEATTDDKESSNTESSGESDAEPASGNSTKRPLHEMIFDAAQQCEHPMLHSFMEKMKASGSSPKEIHAGVLVFHDLPLPEKLRLLFDILGESNSSDDSPSDSNKVPTLSRDGAKYLFRSVIVAISSCIHQGKRVQIEMEKDPVEHEPPAKRRKVTPSSPDSDKSVKSNENSTGGDSVPALQSPSRSFDSSLGVSKDDDEYAASAVRKEFEEIATYATDRLIRFWHRHTGNKSDPAAISFESFDKWRKVEGGKIAPWLELLNLSRWKTPQRQTAKPSSSAPKPEAVATAKESKVETQEPAKPEAVPSESTSSKSSPDKAAATPQQVSEPVAASPMFQDTCESRTVVSFDFTGSTKGEKEPVFCINITEQNLSTLRNIVRNTGLATRPTFEIIDILMGAAKQKGDTSVVPIERFHTCLHQLLGLGSQKSMSKLDKDIFSSSFVDFFSCFDTRRPPLESGEVDAKYLAVGFCFLCAGNKSAKLAAGFQLLESEKNVGLTTDQLTEFLRAYLTMLCGISLLTSSSDGIMKPKLNSARRQAMNEAVENGSKWTLAHFLKTTGRAKDAVHSFEAFAGWYTNGGFNVAPWLELLDLKKLLSLVGDAPHADPRTPPTQHPEALPPFPGSASGMPDFSPHLDVSAHSPGVAVAHDMYALSPPSISPNEVLFTFPLANQRSLVVLKEDASYVRKVVDQLGLTAMAPAEIWSLLHGIASKRPPLPPHRGASASESTGKAMHVNKSTFVECMQDLITTKNTNKKRSARGVSTSATGARDVLVNFFHSFDLLQIDRVALNELMGGLTLLCGGKKSTKLAFAFGVFDQRSQPKGKRAKKEQAVNSLGGEDLFLFLRSFLIVMFSCCRQSWDLSDDSVNRYIADTANMVTEDVMRYQWRTRKRDRVDFDEFGQWYNEGGFETAPWLELLDLKKWVLVESRDTTFDMLPTGASPGVHTSPSARSVLGDCPPPPPEDSVDPSFFDDDAAGIMQMDSIDEMDLLLMQPTHDKENDAELNKIARGLTSSPGKPKARENGKSSSALKFQLVTEDDNGGYVVSVSQKRIRHLRHLLTESGLFKLDGEVAAQEILSKAYCDDVSGKYAMSKDDFDSAMRVVINSQRMSVDSQRSLSAILSEIFTAFDYRGTGQVNASEVACGFTVFCKGKKSDKLEYAFEVLDRDHRGKLSQSDTAKYLRSFLTVLLNVVSTSSLDSDAHDDVMATTGGMRCERTMATVARAVEAGSSWAASQAFRNRHGSRDTICFDEFAEWYTNVGYINIPWLELLDLHKWVITEH
eukprot:Nitzschia sp. Nitz4//scaffold8_size234185//160734//164807//NITZ4_001279-RA/size234185-processed-gene-0.123-mRNA-1//1//CDS//3329559872//3181//frame0